jgi:hypothetical protein
LPTASPVDPGAAIGSKKKAVSEWLKTFHASRKTVPVVYDRKPKVISRNGAEIVQEPQMCSGDHDCGPEGKCNTTNVEGARQCWAKVTTTAYYGEDTAALRKSQQRLEQRLVKRPGKFPGKLLTPNIAAMLQKMSAQGTDADTRNGTKAVDRMRMRKREDGMAGISPGMLGKLKALEMHAAARRAGLAREVKEVLAAQKKNASTEEYNAMMTKALSRVASMGAMEDATLSGVHKLLKRATGGAATLRNSLAQSPGAKKKALSLMSTADNRHMAMVALRDEVKVAALTQKLKEEEEELKHAKVEGVTEEAGRAMAWLSNQTERSKRRAEEAARVKMVALNKTVDNMKQHVAEVVRNQTREKKELKHRLAMVQSIGTFYRASYIVPHTSYLIHYTSYIPHTSHIIPPTSYTS